MILMLVVAAALLTVDQRVDPDAVLDRLDTYLEAYERELSTVVADEELIQETDGRLMRKQARRLNSEIAFIRLPGDREWLGFRSVRIVNGTPLTGVKPLAELLASTSTDTLQQTSLLVNESAKYNLGNPRTINMPNLPLELLSRKYRHRYEVSPKGRSRVRDRAVDEIELSEIGGTPIVYNEGPPMHSAVRAWIDAETGVLWRAEVTLKASGDRRNPTWLRIDFARDAGLDVVVPVTMRERFNSLADTGTSVATYTNFRRFQTSGRIVPQGAGDSADACDEGDEGDEADEGDESEAETLRARLHAYLTDYQPKLSALIADEVMVQQNVRGSRSTGGIGPRQFRTIRSEVAFIALPGDRQWLGFRRVMQVGSDAIDQRAGSLAAMLAAGDQDDYSKARGMLAESARYNLGSPRTTNLPNLPLEFLHPRHAARFSVRIDGEEHMQGKRTVRLVFVEQATPTFITAQDGTGMRSVVTAWMERDTGRLWRADVSTRDPQKGEWAFDHVVSVLFKEQKSLGLLVPATMREQFFAGENRLGTGDASYSNYRRFQTSARIVPQP